MIHAVVPGSVIAGRFTVVRNIARSPMSLVVEATDTDGRHVAVKLLETDSTSSSDAHVRFEREGRLVTSLKSTHVVRVFEIGTTPEGRPFLVMELLAGSTIARELKKRERIPVEEAAAYIAETCDALIEAHDAGIVHRDIKPQNLFLTQAGDKRVVKVLDFGISKMMNPGDQITMTDALFGSPLYMAPETFRAAKLADARSDVWALGVVLYEMVTGISPFAAESPVAVGLKVTREPFVPASWKCPDLPAELDSVIGRALAKAPHERFQTVRAFLRALSPFLPAGHDTLVSRIAFQEPPSHAADDDNPRTMAERDIITKIREGEDNGHTDRVSLDAVPTRVAATGDYEATTKVKAVSSPQLTPLPVADVSSSRRGMTTVMPMIEGPPPTSAPPTSDAQVIDTGRLASPMSVTTNPLVTTSPRSKLLIAALVAAPAFGIIGYLAGHHSDPPPQSAKTESASVATATATSVKTSTPAPTQTAATTATATATSAALAATVDTTPKPAETATAPSASASATTHPKTPTYVAPHPGSKRYNPAAP